MSNIENNFNPDCAEDERLTRPTPDVTDHVNPSAQAECNVNPEHAERERELIAKLDKHREAKRSLTISEAMQRSMTRIDDVFKDSWNAVKDRHPEDSLAVRLMTFQCVIAKTLSQMKPALLDITMSQLHTSIVPLLSAEERAELDRVTLDDVLHDMVKQILK